MPSSAVLVKNFVIIGHHTCPTKAMKEMEELFGVFQAVKKKWKTENVMLLGDLNADCGYVTIKGLKSLRLRNDPRFRWLITDEEDTTVRDKTHCAYDRIIVHGKELISGIVPESAQPFNFKNEFRLTEQEALEVSDHYPVEVDLKPSHHYLEVTLKQRGITKAFWHHLQFLTKRMEQNIADLLKDAFSEVDIDFEHVQFEEVPNTSQIHLVMDEEIDLKDASKLWPTSDQGSVETFSSVYKQEENEDSTDSSEESASSNQHPVETGCAHFPSQEMDSDQSAEKTTTEMKQVDQAKEECTVEDESIQSDEEIDVSMHEIVANVSILEETEDLSQDEELSLESVEDQRTSSEEYQQLLEQMSSGLVPNETPEERSSGSDEEGPVICSTREQTSQCDSNGNMEEPLSAIKENMSAGYHVGDDLREFTEEDQEQIEESLADYPSDLSQSETEECAESAGDQTSALLDSSLSLSNDQLNKTKELSHAEEDNLQEEDKSMDFTSTDSDSEIKGPEVQTISEASDVDASVQSENADEDDVEESLTKKSSTEEDTRNQGMGDERDASNGNNQDQPDYDSDISSDHSTSQEEITEGFVRHKEDWKCDIQQNDFIEDLSRADLDIDYIGIDTEDRDGSNPEMDSDFTNSSPFSYAQYCKEESNEESNESYPTLQSVHLDPAIKEQEIPLVEILTNVRDPNTLISEVFWSSELLMSESKLLDDYDWDLTGEQQLEVNVGEEENQEDTEEVLEELDNDDDGEEKARDWEQEKTRIEAFYRYYNQDEQEDKADRNHKVTFCLDHESSEYEEESESSEEELDKDPDIPPTTIKPEYNSESDDELQEKHFIPEKPKLQPKEQQPVSPTWNASPPRNKCLAVLKSVLALGLVTAVGMVSFWWATDNLEWIR
ncbi:hypothetical protein AOLI_G00077020 [Acnodon oligacanthus]